MPCTTLPVEGVKSSLRHFSLTLRAAGYADVLEMIVLQMSPVLVNLRVA